MMDPTQIMQQGNEAFSGGHYPKALRHYKQALEGVREDPNPLADLYGNIGNVYAVTGKIDEAVLWYQKAITILRQLEDYSRLGMTYVNVGNLYMDQGDREKALHFYKQGLLLLENSQERAALSLLYGNLSRLYLQQSKALIALEYAEKAMVLATKLNRPKLIAEMFQKLAKAREGMGEIKAARASSESAYAIYQNMRDEMGCASALFHQVALYEKEGDLDAAISCLREVVAIDEKYQLPKLHDNKKRLKKLEARSRKEVTRPPER